MNVVGDLLPQTPISFNDWSKKCWKTIEAASANRLIRTICDFSTAPFLPPRVCEAPPRDIQQRARDAYRRFQTDPMHPGLQFKRLHTTLPLWSVRVTGSYGAVGAREGDQIIWFYIGTHAEYDRLLSGLT